MWYVRWVNAETPEPESGLCYSQTVSSWQVINILLLQDYNTSIL